MATTEEELPMNWVAKTDDASGRKFYLNVVTGAKQWRRPSDPLPPNWRSAVDDRTGRRYFYNSVTKETSWRRPTLTEDPLADQPLPEGWSEAVDPTSGRTYYYHLASKTSSWHRPVESAQKLGDLPRPWVSKVDESTGRVFYYNPETKATTWYRPGVEDGDDAAASAKTWEERRDTVSGKLYWVNTTSHQTTFVRPSVLQQSIAPKAQRQNIFTEPIESIAKVELRTIPKPEASRQLIRAALSRAFMFGGLKTEELEAVVNAMQERRVATGETIIRQGEKGDNFYVVETGTFDIFVDGIGQVATRGPGDLFGEMALLYNCPRAATVKSTSAAKLWALDRLTFRYMVAQSSGEKLEAIRTGLRAAPLLASLSAAQISRVAEVVQVMEYRSGDIIFRKGEEGNFFFIVKSGNVVITELTAGDEALPDLRLAAGATFGERALLKSEPRAATVIAETDATCLVIGRADFSQHLGPLAEILDRDLAMRVLESIPQLSILSSMERESLVQAFETKSYDNGVTIVSEGDMLDTLYVVKAGKATVRVENSVVRTYAAGDRWGASALDADMRMDVDIVASGKVSCFLLSRSKLEDIIGGTLRDFQTRRPKITESKAAETKQPDTRPNIAFTDLEDISLLGCGSFGRVSLVRHRKTGQPYALKRLLKAQIVATKQEKNVMNEKRIMMQLNHTFVLRLFTTFQDTNCLYMLMELCLGGELFQHLAAQPKQCVSEDAARFYAAGVILAIEHLHEFSIAYRDMKPENMLIDEQGYIKLIDFGFAKRVDDRTYTLCGTPEYLAPEVILGTGHGKGVDYWAIGVLIFEMLVGSSPFADHATNDHMVVCRNIVEASLRIPRAVSADASSLIKALLNRTVPARYGCRKGGIGEIKAHKWFKKFDWVKLLSRELKAPWKPPIRDPFDSSNFRPEDYSPDIEPYSGDQSWCHDF